MFLPVIIPVQTGTQRFQAFLGARLRGHDSLSEKINKILATLRYLVILRVVLCSKICSNERVMSSCGRSYGRLI